MRWYCKLGHYFLKWIQLLMQTGQDGQPPVIPMPTNSQPNCCDTTGLLCASCQYGKGAQTGTRATYSKETAPGALRAEDLTPGKMVSEDQYISKIKGCLPHTKGKESALSRYSGGTIFYDHASKLIHISNQVTLIASDTVCGKLKCERVAAGHGFTIEQYHGDNGIFKSQLWSDSCEEAGQLPTSMGGVGAHHQNAVAEQSIGTIVRSARTMLLHATIYWPKVFDLMFWPFALQYAVGIWNCMPDINMKLSPMDIFSRTVLDHTDLLNSHVWGCPAYVLNPTLQDRKKLPKWSPRKQHGLFLGWIKSHASSVALVRNLNTGSITL
eukprot:8678064-Ditylum_brightwellii.AAC.1